MSELLTVNDRETLALLDERFRSDEWKQLDAVEEKMEACEQIERPLNHIFTETMFSGVYLYTREIFMKAGDVIMSRIHLYRHTFIISMGCVSVWDNGWKTMRAPYTGVTEPGTRRILYIHEDTVWSTFHVTDKEDPDKVVLDVTFSKGKYQSLGPAAAAPQLCN